MRIESASFLCSARKLSDCPDSSSPEFAFIGRSNVGKSSLINCLLRKDGLARVSKTPGRTRDLNFFSINRTWTVVDLPGYGFAKVSQAQREQFNEMVSDFLIQRANLLGTFLLVDSRHPPQAIDLQFVAWLIECELPFALIFTKVDKNKAKVVDRHIARFCEAMTEFSEGTPTVFKASSKTGAGRKEILSFIGEAIEAAKA